MATLKLFHSSANTDRDLGQQGGVSLTERVLAWVHAYAAAKTHLALATDPAERAVFVQVAQRALAELRRAVERLE
jgi:hypothetical protein